MISTLQAVETADKILERNIQIRRIARYTRVRTY